MHHESQKTALCFGDKIALQVQRVSSPNNAPGFARHINNSQIPLAVIGVPPGRRVPSGFENCIFQLLSGDGDVKNSSSFILGTPVNYGQVVRLLHVKTNMLVCCTKRHKAFMQKANHKVSFETMSESAKGNRWRILPRYRVKGEGERVCSDDETVFMLQGSGMYLHTSSAPSEMDEGQGIDALYYEINCSSALESAGVAFRCHAYDTSRLSRGTQMLTRPVCCGDCVTLLHRQENGYITVGRQEQLGKSNTETLVVYIDTTATPSSHALFLTEAQDALYGGPMQFGKGSLYRLKNLSSGKYLCVVQKDKDEGDDDDDESVCEDAVDIGLGQSMGSMESLAGSPIATSVTMSFNNEENVLDRLTICLVDDALTPGTLLSLFQTSEDATPLIHNYARVTIQCIDVDCEDNPTAWLTVGSKIKDVQTSLSMSRRVRPVKEKQTLRELCLGRDPVQRDGMQIRVVDPTVFNRLYFVHNLLPSLKQCTKAFLSGTVPSEQRLISAKDALAELIVYCTKSTESNPYERVGIPIVELRDLLVDQHTPRLCLELAEVVFSPQCVTRLTQDNINSPQFVRPGMNVRVCDVRSLVCLALRLCRLCIDSPGGASQIKGFLPFLMRTATYGVGAMGCLLSYCKASSPMVTSPEDYHTLEFAVRTLSEHRYYTKGLELLRRLMYVKEGNCYAQEKTLELLQSVTPSLLLLVTSSGGGPAMIEVPGPPLPCEGSRMVNTELLAWCANKESIHGMPVTGTPRTMTTSKVTHSSDAKEDPRIAIYATPMLDFFVEQLNFLTCMCSGRNAKAREYSMTLVKAKDLLDIVYLETALPAVRSAALRLYRSYEVDVDPYVPLQTKVMAKLWGRLEEDVLRVSCPFPPHLEVVATWCVDALTKNCSLSYRSNAEPMNTFIKEIVKTIRLMVTYSWVHGDLRLLLLRALVTILKSDSDILPEPDDAGYDTATFDRSDFSEHSEGLLKCKEYITELLHIMYDLAVMDQVQTAILAFAAKEPPPHWSDLSGCGFCPDLHVISRRRAAVIAKQKSSQLAPINISFGDFGDFGNRVVPAVESQYDFLRDLHRALFEGLMFKENVVATANLSLLLRVFDYRHEIFTVMSLVQLVSEDSLSFYQTATIAQSQLAKYTGKHHVLNLDEVLPSLDCVVHVLDKVGQELAQQQLIMMTIGTHDTILALLKKVKLGKNTKTSRPVLEACYEALSRMCFNNNSLCGIVFEQIDFILTHLEYNVGVLELLVIMLDENVELLVNVPDSFFRHILTVMVDQDNSPSYAFFLRKIVWFGNKPVPKVQKLLWKEILARHVDAEGGGMPKSLQLLRIHGAWTGDFGISHRTLLLDEKEYEDPSGKICFHIEWLTLLWCLVKGKNSTDPRLKEAKRELALIAFHGHGVEDVIEVISNVSLPLFYRHVYVRLFHEVFAEDEIHSAVIAKQSEALFMFVDISVREIAAFEAAVRTLGERPMLMSDIEAIFSEKMGTPSSTPHIECYVAYIFASLLQCLKRIVGSIMYGEHHTVRPTVALRRRMNDLVDAVVAIGESQRGMSAEANASVGKGWFPIQRMSPTRKLGTSHRKHNFVFPSEHAQRDQRIAPTSLHAFVMTSKDSEHVMELLEECASRGMYGSSTKPGVDATIAFLRTCISQGEDTASPPKRRDAVCTTGDWTGGSTDNVHPLFQWKDFVRSYKVNDNERFVALALHVLSLGRKGDVFLKNIVAHLRQGCLSVEERTHLFMFLTRVIDARDPERESDVWLVYPAKVPTVMADGMESQYKVVYHMDTTERQSHVDRTTDLSAVVVEYVSVEDDLSNMAVSGGITFLEGGNAQVQSTMHQYFLHRRDEIIFQSFRNRIVAHQTTLKRKYEDSVRLMGTFEPGPLTDQALRKLHDKYDLTVITRVLRFLQLLCEGHNLAVQDYLRIQCDNQVSVDVVEATTALLVSVLRSQVDRMTHPLCMQTIATLTEFVQGPCAGNQRRLIGSNIGNAVNLLMDSRTKWPDLNATDQWKLREQAATLLLSLIEGRIAPTLAAELVQTLQLDVLATLMDESLNLWVGEHHGGVWPSDINELVGGPERGRDKNTFLASGMAGVASTRKMVGHILSSVIGPTQTSIFDDKLNLGCNIFIFFRAVVDMASLTSASFVSVDQGGDGMGPAPKVSGTEYWDRIRDRDSLTVRACLRTHHSYRYFNTLVGAIEVLRAGTVEKVYFRVPPNLKKNLRSASRENVLKDVNRDSLSSKLTDFFDKATDLIYEINFFEEMSNTRGMSFIHEYYAHFDLISLALSVTLNVYLFSFVEYKNLGDYGMSEGAVSESFSILENIAVAIQVCLTLHFVFGELRIHVAYQWRQWNSEKREVAVKKSKRNMALDDPVLDDDPSQRLHPVHRGLLSVTMMAWHWPLWQRFVFLFSTMLGKLVHPVFYSIQLMQVIARSPQLQNVVLAVTKNGRALLLTIGLLFIFIYIFAVIAYYEYSMFFSNKDMGDGFNCDTLRKCAILMVAYGLRQGGGVGDLERPPNWGDSTEHIAGRVIFDFLFFAIVIIIFLNIVFGIIIDTFAELREKRESMYEDQKGTCFMCGIDKATMDRRAAAAGGFDHHYKSDHNMWQYVYFMHYLTKKPTDDLNGQETFVHNLVRRREIGFFPMGRAMMLEAIEDALGEDESDRTSQVLVKHTADGMDRIEQHLHGMDARIAGRVGALDARIRSSMAVLLKQKRNQQE